LSSSIVMPDKLLSYALQKGMRMPQLVLYIPAKTSISFKAQVNPRTPLYIVGFSFSGVDANGSRIRGYDFANDRGIMWKGVYRNIPYLLEDVETPWFYVTEDYLDKFVPYGPRIISKEIETTIVNNYDVPVFFTQTMYCYTILLEDLMDVLGIPEEQRKLILQSI